MNLASAGLICMQLLFAGAASAQAPAPAEPEPPIPVATVPGQKNLVAWPYRTLLAGLDAFESKRSLAPVAALRFKLRPIRQPDVPGDLSLHLVGPDWSTPLALGADISFVLPRSSAGSDDDVQLVINRKSDEFDARNLPRADVHSPGLAPNVRRVGDLRLECHVAMAVAKKAFGFILSMSLSAAGGMDWCNPRQKTGYSAGPGRPFDKVEMVDRQRRLTLWEGSARTSYGIPVADASWPDDALIEFRLLAAP